MALLARTIVVEARRRIDFVSRHSALLSALGQDRINVNVQCSQPLLNIFSVSNQSPIPIRNMRIGCAVPLVYYDDKYVKEELHGDTWFGNPELFRDSDDGVSLDPYGQHSFRCESILSVQIHGQLV